jgi:hypothetical protein
MRLLRDRWRRTALAKYFDGLEPIDRVNYVLACVLAPVAGWSAIVIARAWWP